MMRLLVKAGWRRNEQMAQIMTYLDDHGFEVRARRDILIIIIIREQEEKK